MPNHSLFWLALMTFLVVCAYVAWSFLSTRRRQLYGPHVSGPGNEDGPMAGRRIPLPYVFDNREHPRPGPRPGERPRPGVAAAR